MKGIKVSACIITYNQQDFIRDCLEGAISQELDYDYEIVVGDDCSTDNTFQICQEYADKYPDKIRLLSREKNLGMVGNWMATIQACEGKYIALCEGDDYWTDKTKLQKQVDFLENNPEYTLTFHNVSVLRPNGKLGSDFLTKLPENHETIEDLAVVWNYIHTPSVIFRNVITEFPYEFQMTPICDYFLYMMLAEKGKLKHFEDNMATYRYGVGIFSGDSELKIIKNNLILLSLLTSYFKEGEVKKILLRRQLRSISILEEYLTNGIKISTKLKKDFVRVVKKIKRKR